MKWYAVCIPAVEQRIITAQRRRTPKEGSRSSRSNHGNERHGEKKVLLVDNGPCFCFAASETIGMAGYLVRIAEDGNGFDLLVAKPVVLKNRVVELIQNRPVDHDPGPPDNLPATGKPDNGPGLTGSVKIDE